MTVSPLKHWGGRGAWRKVQSVFPPRPHSPPSEEAEGSSSRWGFLTTLPVPSAPPSPFLPSEMKYSASLVRGQAATHLLLGALLFLTGVLGSRHNTNTSSSTSVGLWTGTAAIACGAAGLMAHRLWYKNWTIKAFLVASTAALALCVLGLGLTFYHIAVTSHLGARHHVPGVVVLAVPPEEGGEEGRHAVKDVFFDSRPPPPLNRTLIVNLTLSLLAELVLSLWSLTVSWRGVRAEEFTSTRRDAIVKEGVSGEACVSTTDEEAGGTLPLAALYHLLQTHPELLKSKLQWGSSAPSHRSMDYQERVSRYLEQQTDAHAHRNPSPTSAISLTKKIRSSSVPPGSDKTVGKRRLRTSSEHKSMSKDCRTENDQADNDSQDCSSSPVPSSPIDSTSFESPSDSSPSSTMQRIESCDADGNLTSEKKETQSLVLSLKTLSPLSSHVINPSEMIPGKNKFSNVQLRPVSNGLSSGKENEAFVPDNCEYNVSFVHAAEKPPPLPKKKFSKPKLVINKKLHTESISKDVGHPPASLVSKSCSEDPSYLEKNHIKAKSNFDESSAKNISKAGKRRNKITTLIRKKDKKPPPVPEKSSSPPKEDRLNETPELCIAEGASKQRGVRSETADSDNVQEMTTDRLVEKMDDTEMKRQVKQEQVITERHEEGRDSVNQKKETSQPVDTNGKTRNHLDTNAPNKDFVETNNDVAEKVRTNKQETAITGSLGLVQTKINNLLAEKANTTEEDAKELIKENNRMGCRVVGVVKAKGARSQQVSIQKNIICTDGTSGGKPTNSGLDVRVRQPLEIEIRPYETKKIIIDRDKERKLET